MSYAFLMVLALAALQSPDQYSQSRNAADTKKYTASGEFMAMASTPTIPIIGTCPAKVPPLVEVSPDSQTCELKVNAQCFQSVSREDFHFKIPTADWARIRLVDIDFGPDKLTAREAWLLYRLMLVLHPELCGEVGK